VCVLGGGHELSRRAPRTPTIFVVNRQTYETYRFTIGDDVALAHVGPPSDLAEARRTAIAFLAQRERKNSPGGVPLTPDVMCQSFRCP
jgi:hypothetical protein